MLRISGIYKIQSQTKPSRYYIGSAVNIHKRWQYHLQDLKRDKHHSKKLQRHFNKYGESDIQFSIILSCDKEDLLKIEQYFIDSYNPYFNVCKKAGSQLGRHWKVSKEGRKNILEGRMGNQSHKGQHHSEETRQKMSKAAKIVWVRRKLKEAI